MPGQRLLMDGEDMRRALTRIAHEIVERNHGAADLALVGILRRGAPLAERLAAIIERVEGVAPPVGRLDIALYRDDYDTSGKLPAVASSNIPFDPSGKQIVLVDEVIYTGRTVRAAISALFEYGRPDSIQLAVMLDRGHRELPIRPDYVGKNVPTSRNEHVDCRLSELDGEDVVYLSSVEAG